MNPNLLLPVLAQLIPVVRGKVEAEDVAKRTVVALSAGEGAASISSSMSDKDDDDDERREAIRRDLSESSHRILFACIQNERKSRV
jgi:hypothetical protein